VGAVSALTDRNCGPARRALLKALRMFLKYRGRSFNPHRLDWLLNHKNDSIRGSASRVLH
jgi:hypothetical protein